MRVDKAFFTRAEMPQRIVVVGFLFHERMLGHTAFPVAYHLVLERLVCVVSRLERLELVSVVLIIYGECPAVFYLLREFVPAQAGHVGLEYLSLFRVVACDTVCYLEARIDKFGLVFRTFEDWLAVYLDQFVYIAETWIGLACGNSVSHSV